MRKTLTNKPQNSNRGLAGVAALIIFIAIVLVGAITAAVILDVSGSLEQQAAQTGQDASNQISSTLQILERSGQVSSSPATDGLNQVSFVVTVAPGTPAINLTDTLITVTGPENRFDLVAENTFSNSNADGDFQISQIIPDTSSNVIEGPQQRFNVTVPSSSSSITGNPATNLEYLPNERYEFTFTSGPGGQAFQNVRIPPTVTAGDTISL